MTRSSTRLPRPKRLFAAAAVVACLVAAPANATRIVNDPMPMAKALEGIRRADQALERHGQAVPDAVGAYQQQLIKLQRLQFGDSPMADNFPERPQDYGLDDSCPGAGQSGIAEPMNQLAALAPDMNGSAVDEQMKVCSRIAMAKNAQYNETVRMLKRMIQRNERFKQVRARRDKVGTSQKSLAANDNEVQRFVAGASH